MTDTSDKVRKSAPGDSSGVLQDAVQCLIGTATNRALSSVTGKVQNTSGRLTEYAEGGGGGLLSAVTGAEKRDDGESGLKSAIRGGWEGTKNKVMDTASNVKEAVTGGGGEGKGGKGKKFKFTNIVESIDVGVPVQLAYDQWTQFADFPSFMKKVEQVEQVSDEKLQWKAQVFWSHRTWESTIVEQVPAERIVWRSKGAKGYVDGAVTFHDLTPDLTRILVILEYHPQGFFEKTGNLWRAQGRRARLELKNFQRHVMTDTVLHPDDVEGWPGEIRDGEVVEPEHDEDTGEDFEDEDEDEAVAGDEPDADDAGEDAESYDDSVDAESDDDHVDDDDSILTDEEDEDQTPPRRRGRPRKTTAARSGRSRQGAGR
ncbi:SRPBCC family protein [Gordonia sp. YY1]|uniref:SRPBCC family protein n=1 Tax=Gordonia sp. YY1 TaxID=396712 RepID=UPI0013319C21|nr:SRPBCC family protein [Gordonia sp. YY1]